MPSKPVGGRTPPGGFDSRPPPRRERGCDLGFRGHPRDLWPKQPADSPTRGRLVRSRPPHLIGGLASPDGPLHLGILGSPAIFLLIGRQLAPDKCLRRCFGVNRTSVAFSRGTDRTSLPIDPARTTFLLRAPNPEEEEEEMARPARRPIAVAPATVDDLREEFLASCRAKNLSERTVEWYEEKIRRFAEWCSQEGAADAASLTASHLDAYLIELKDRGYAPQTVRGFAQVVKTLCRFGYRRGFLARDLAFDLEMPKVPQRIIRTFTDDQLAALLAAPDTRRWIGVRDRAILLTMADTLARASELATLRASSVDLAQRVVTVMGKGARERQLPLGAIASGRCTATVALSRTYAPATRSSSPVGEGPWIASTCGRSSLAMGRRRASPACGAPPHPAPHRRKALHSCRRRRVHPPAPARAHLPGDGQALRRARRGRRRPAARAVQPRRLSAAKTHTKAGG